jgi:hypothetical protein
MGEVLHRQPAKGRVLRLPRDQFGFPQNRQPSQRVQRRHRRHPVRRQLRVQSDQLVGRAFIAAARLQRVEMLVFPVQHQLSHRLRRR